MFSKVKVEKSWMRFVLAAANRCPPWLKEHCVCIIIMSTRLCCIVAGNVRDFHTVVPPSTIVFLCIRGGVHKFL